MQKNFAELARTAIPQELAGRSVEIWFQDEARVGQQGTLTRIWAKRGTRPCIRRDLTVHLGLICLVPVCPARGTGAALVMPTVSVEAMNKHLAEISQCVSVSAIALLILDGAGWHSSPQLIVPENIVLMPLPPYAPELNSEFRTSGSTCAATGSATASGKPTRPSSRRVATPGNDLMAKSEIITSIGTREWAQVKI